jgi:hypothetical protein
VLLLRPDDGTNNGFIYRPALAARRAKVQVTFSVAMSKRYHAGIHDPDGSFSIFAEPIRGFSA